MSLSFSFEHRHERLIWLDLQKLLSPSCRANPYRQIPDTWWHPKKIGGDGLWKLSVEDVEGHTGVVESPFEPIKNGRGGWQPWSMEDHLGRIRFFLVQIRRREAVDPVELATVGMRRATLAEGWHRIAALALVGRKKVRVRIEYRPDSRKVDALRYRRSAG